MGILLCDNITSQDPSQIMGMGCNSDLARGVAIVDILNFLCENQCTWNEIECFDIDIEPGDITGEWESQAGCSPLCGNLAIAIDEDCNIIIYVYNGTEWCEFTGSSETTWALENTDAVEISPSNTYDRTDTSGGYLTMFSGTCYTTGEQGDQPLSIETGDLIQITFMMKETITQFVCATNPVDSVDIRVTFGGGGQPVNHTLLLDNITNGLGWMTWTRTFEALANGTIDYLVEGSFGGTGVGGVCPPTDNLWHWQVEMKFIQVTVIR